MKLVKFRPDQENIFYLKNVTAAVWTGLQENIPTMICVQAEEGEIGKDLRFFVKKLGDNITAVELTKQVVIALVNDEVEYLVLSDKPSMLEVANAHNAPLTPPAGPQVPGWPPK